MTNEQAIKLDTHMLSKLKQRGLGQPAGYLKLSEKEELELQIKKSNPFYIGQFMGINIYKHSGKSESYLCKDWQYPRSK